MSKFSDRLTRALVEAGVVAAAMASTLCPITALAQSRAALVKNADEPGRQPYEYYIQFNRFGCNALANCSNFVALFGAYLFDGPPVPAGKRLVLQWISAAVPSNNTAVTLTLQSTQIISQQSLKFGFGGPFFAPYVGIAYMSSGLFATYGPGERPHINIGIGSPSAYDGSVTLAGYLIDATN